MQFPGPVDGEIPCPQRVSGVPSVQPMRYDSNMCSTVSSAGVEADVASADTALTAALRDGVEHLTHDQSTALLAQLRALTAKADALTLAVVGKVDADGTHAYDGCLSASAWVKAVGHQSSAEAARTVRTARTLRSGVLPNTTAALAAGAITGPARGGDRRRRQGRPRRRGRADRAGGGRHRRRGGRGGDGERDAPLPARPGPRHGRREGAAALRAGRDHVLRRCSTAGSPSPAPPTRPPARPSSPPSTPPSPLVTGDTRTAARRRLDGLHRICRHWLDTAEPDGDTADPTARRTSRSRARLIVTIDQPGSPDSTSPGGTLSWAGPITASTAQRLGCDSDATFVTLDPDGNVVEAGTQRRFFTQRQRLAMIARDGDTLRRPLLRPALRLVRRPPPRPGLRGRTDHHRQRRPPLRRPPRSSSTKATGPSNRLPDGRYLMRHPQNRQDPRTRTTPPRPQPTTTRRTAR